MSDIFISYAREDRDTAERFAIALKEQGFSVWWDSVIPTGRAFDEVIEEAIGASNCVVVLWSNHSIKSNWVKTEAEEGVKRNILIPVKIDKIDLPFSFRRYNTADMVEWDGETSNPLFKRLLQDIKRLVKPSVDIVAQRRQQQEKQKQTEAANREAEQKAKQKQQAEDQARIEEEIKTQAAATIKQQEEREAKQKADAIETKKHAQEEKHKQAEAIKRKVEQKEQTIKQQEEQEAKKNTEEKNNKNKVKYTVLVVLVLLVSLVIIFIVQPIEPIKKEKPEIELLKPTLIKGDTLPSEYYVTPGIGRQPDTNIRLSILSEKPNQATDAKDWWIDNSLDSLTYVAPNPLSKITGNIPEIVPLKFNNLMVAKVINSNPLIAIYGKNFIEGQYLLAIDSVSRKQLFAFDFSFLYKLPHLFNGNDKDSLGIVTTWAHVDGETLYVSHSHNTSASLSNEFNAYITAINIPTNKIIWRSQPLVSNAENFIIKDDAIIAGYGFTDEKDYIYVLNKADGRVVQKIPIKTRAESLVKKNEDLYVRSYNTDYVFKFKRANNSTKENENTSSNINKGKKESVIQNGWIYLGSFSNDVWTYKQIDIPTYDKPTEGKPYTLLFNVTVRRNAPEFSFAGYKRGKMLGKLAAGQQVEIIQTKSTLFNDIYAEIKIID